MKMHLVKAAAGSIYILAIILFCPLEVPAQESAVPDYERDTLISAAKEIMEKTRYCALITLDQTGHPQVRTMDPFAPDDDMVVWLGTNKNSRKVSELRHDSRVTLYYEAPEGSGYAVLQGTGQLVDDPGKKEEYWKKDWERFYPDKDSTYTLIKVLPEKLEVIHYRRGITGASETWAVPHIEF